MSEEKEKNIGYAPQEDVDAFMVQAKQAIRYEIPANVESAFNEDQTRLYMDLITEEYQETRDAFKEKDIVALADGLADTVWVIMGMCSTLGIDFYKVWEEVYSSNVSKFTDGQLVKDENGKVQKPEGYKPPDIKSALGL